MWLPFLSSLSQNMFINSTFFIQWGRQKLEKGTRTEAPKTHLVGAGKVGGTGVTTPWPKIFKFLKNNTLYSCNSTRLLGHRGNNFINNNLEAPGSRYHSFVGCWTSGYIRNKPPNWVRVLINELKGILVPSYGLFFVPVEKWPPRPLQLWQPSHTCPSPRGQM